MSNISTAKKSEPVAKPAAKVQSFCGPPWAPNLVVVSEIAKANPLDDALKIAKKGNGGKISETKADFIAATVALNEEAKAGKSAVENVSSNVGNPMWNNVVGPIWAGKEKPQVATDFAGKPGLTEPFIAKQG